MEYKNNESLNDVYNVDVDDLNDELYNIVQYQPQYIHLSSPWNHNQDKIGTYKLLPYYEKACSSLHEKDFKKSRFIIHKHIINRQWQLTEINYPWSKRIIGSSQKITEKDEMKAGVATPELYQTIRDIETELNFRRIQVEKLKEKLNYRHLENKLSFSLLNLMHNEYETQEKILEESFEIKPKKISQNKIFQGDKFSNNFEKMMEHPQRDIIDSESINFQKHKEKKITNVESKFNESKFFKQKNREEICHWLKETLSKTENTHLKEEIEKLKKENNILMNKNINLETNAKKFQSQLYEKDKALGILGNKIKNFKTEIEDVKHNSDLQLKTKNAEISTLINHIEKLKILVNAQNQTHKEKLRLIKIHHEKDFSKCRDLHNKKKLKT